MAGYRTKALGAAEREAATAERIIRVRALHNQRLAKKMPGIESVVGGMLGGGGGKVASSAKKSSKMFGLVRRHPIAFGVAGGAAGYGMMKGRSSGANGLTPNSSGGQGVYGM